MFTNYAVSCKGGGNYTKMAKKWSRKRLRTPLLCGPILRRSLVRQTYYRPLPRGSFSSRAFFGKFPAKIARGIFRNFGSAVSMAVYLERNVQRAKLNYRKGEKNFFFCRSRHRTVLILGQLVSRKSSTTRPNMKNISPIP